MGAKIVNYLNEIKIRIFFLGVILLFNIFLNLYYFKQIIYIVSIPISFINDNRFIYTSITEFFYTYVVLSLYLSSYLLSFSIIINVLLFSINGLYKKEFFIALILFLFFLFSLVSSYYLAYHYILPQSYEYFRNLEINDIFFDIHLMASINEYLSNFLIYYIIITIFSILLTIIMILYLLKIIPLRFLIHHRKDLYFIIIIVLSIITPPDLISFIILLLSIIGLYELLLLLISFSDTYSSFRYCF